MTARLQAFFAAWFLVAALGAPVQAQTAIAALPEASAPANPTGEARPLLAWLQFCERFPAECAVDPAEAATVPLSARLWSTVVAVNRKVNTSIKAVTDQDHWGVPDRWDFAEDRLGDCEDFQIVKRRLLAEAGLPRRAMRMTVVIDEKGEGHAVLMLRTDRGDFILDNKTDTVLPWYRTGYIFVKREGQASATWVSLGGATSPVVTANR